MFVVHPTNRKSFRQQWKESEEFLEKIHKTRINSIILLHTLRRNKDNEKEIDEIIKQEIQKNEESLKAAKKYRYDDLVNKAKSRYNRLAYITCGLTSISETDATPVSNENCCLCILS
jgi:hypothetical protein